MAEVMVEIPDSMKHVVGEDLDTSETKRLLSEAVEDKLRLLLLFKVADNILKDSKLTDEQAAELADELKIRVSKRHGLM